MGNSKSKFLNNKNNTKKKKELSEQINNFFSETRQLYIEDESEEKVNPLDYIYPTVEKSKLGKITDSHHIVEMSLDLISKHCNVELSKKTNQIMYTSLLYPALFESDEKMPQNNLSKTSNYIYAQRAFDKIRDILSINEDGDYVHKEKQLRYKNSTASQSTVNQQKMFNNQSFLSIFNNNNLNASTTSNNAKETDYDRVSIRNYKRNPSMKSNIFDEKRKKSMKSIRNILVTEMSQKKPSLIKIKEIHTEKNSVESENELVGGLSPQVENEKKEEKEKSKYVNNIKRINYGYELQKNLLKKIRNIDLNKNDDEHDDTRLNEMNLKEINKYNTEGHLDIHKKLGKANYSWLKNIINLGNKKKSTKKRKFDFKINIREIIKQTVKEEPDKKTKENGKRLNGKSIKEIFMNPPDISDTNQFKIDVEKYLGVENKTNLSKSKKTYRYTHRLSPSKLRETQNDEKNKNNLIQGSLPIPYSEEIKNKFTEDLTSEYETPDEDNSYIQLNRIKTNYLNNANYENYMNPSENEKNSSYDSEDYEYDIEAYENGFERSLDAIDIDKYRT